MSIESEDIDAAVTAGVIPQAQADALRAFVATRHRSRLEQAGAEDERFRFMTGFNDFFFAIGVLLLGSGLLFFAADIPARSLVGAAVIWALSELLVGRIRLVLPGILLSLFFIFFVFLSVPENFVAFTSPSQPAPFSVLRVFSTIFMSGSDIGAAPVKALIGLAAAALYYWRFRLPFTLLPIAISFVLLFMSSVALTGYATSPARWSLVILAGGLAVFATAMAYDMSDRERQTRRSDCAFWLHLLAAPMIVHSLISLIAPNLVQITDGIAAGILLIVAILGLVAIAIDRRALLVSALAYIGIVIVYAGAMWTGQKGPPQVDILFYSTLCILGAFVIALGVGWQPLRRGLLALISPSIARKLPPVPKIT